MAELNMVALGAFVALAGGALGLWRGRRQWSIRREIKSADEVTAGSMLPGVAGLSGTVEPAEETFSSPLTGRECVAYQYEVEEKRRTTTNTGRGGSSTKTKWVTVTDRERAAPFYLDDGTGRAMIDAPVAEFELKKAHGIKALGSKIEPTGRLKAMLTGGDAGEDLPITEEVRREAEAAGRERRYEERLIMPEESVYVYGEAMRPEEVPREESGIASLAGMLGASDWFGKSLLGPLVSGTTGDTAGYRRSSRRDYEVSTDAVPESSSAMEAIEQQRQEFETKRERLEQQREQLEHLQDKDPSEMTRAERRKLQEMAEEMAPDVEDIPTSVGEVVEDAADTPFEPAGPGTDPLEGESLVVSRGDTIGEFVVSDYEKGRVVRSYTTGALKWAAVALVSVAVGALLIASGLGIDVAGMVRSRLATLAGPAWLAVLAPTGRVRRADGPASRGSRRRRCRSGRSGSPPRSPPAPPRGRF